MIVKLFEIQNNVVIPTEHCYTLKALKDIMDDYPEDYLKIYQYLFYKGAYKDLQEEQQSKVRGGQGLAYDM